MKLCFCDRKWQTSSERVTSANWVYFFVLFFYPGTLSLSWRVTQLYIAAACTAPSGVSHWKIILENKRWSMKGRLTGGIKTQQVLLCFCFLLNPSEFCRRETVQGQSNMNYITRLSSVEKEPWNPFSCRGSIFCQRNKKIRCLFIILLHKTKHDY